MPEACILDDLAGLIHLLHIDQKTTRYGTNGAVQNAHGLIGDKVRDAAYIERVETALAEKNSLGSRRVPPMFLPLRLRGMTLTNRVVVAPMSMYSAEDGTPNDFHLVH